MFKKEDLQVSVYPDDRVGLFLKPPSGIKVVHVPSGTTVIVNKHRNMYANKEEAIRILQSQVL